MSLADDCAQLNSRAENLDTRDKLLPTGAAEATISSMLIVSAFLRTLRFSRYL